MNVDGPFSTHADRIVECLNGSEHTVTSLLVRSRLAVCSLTFNFPLFARLSAWPARFFSPQLGPEGVLINELEGNAPQKVIADVRLTCEEEFVLEDGSGNVVHRNDSKGPVVRRRGEA